jgi:hypothetical protein
MCDKNTLNLITQKVCDAANISPFYLNVQEEGVELYA